MTNYCWSDWGKVDMLDSQSVGNPKEKTLGIVKSKYCEFYLKVFLRFVSMKTFFSPPT